MPKKALKCMSCGKMTRTQYVTITFRGLKIKTFKPGLHCSSCYKKEAVKKVNELIARGYFCILLGKISINWKECLKAYSRQSSWNNDWSGLLSVLAKLEVLSFDMPGNFVIHRFGSDLNLYICNYAVFFTDRANAQGFINAYLARYGGTENDMIAAQFA